MRQVDSIHSYHHPFAVRSICLHHIMSGPSTWLPQLATPSPSAPLANLNRISHAAAPPASRVMLLQTRHHPSMRRVKCSKSAGRSAKGFLIGRASSLVYTRVFQSNSRVWPFSTAARKSLKRDGSRWMKEISSHTRSTVKSECILEICMPVPSCVLSV